MVFEELSRLCVSPGYIQALAFICFNESVVGIAGELSGKDLLRLHSQDRLIRTEIVTLVGLTAKAPIDFALPELGTTKRYMEETYRLLRALHQAMWLPFIDQATPDRMETPGFNPFADGNVLREPIFYSGEPAYSFQQRDLAVLKYAADDAWLQQHKGFSIGEARDVVQTFARVQNRKLTDLQSVLRLTSQSEWSVIDAFSASSTEIASSGSCDIRVVKNVLSAFALPDRNRNEDFRSVNDFNACTATPLLRRDADSFLLFSHHSLSQSLYESPFYWMIADPQYRDTAVKNRGDFAERFVHDRLARVFGPRRVFQDVRIQESKARDLTDIDVLVIFGNRAVVVQAKSKKLTLEARKGNDGQIRADFKSAVQDAYDQGYEAASALLKPAFTFRDSAGQPLHVPPLREVFIVTVLSEAYPALAFQARQFLQSRSNEAVRPPIVADVFALDALTEMLESPLWLVDYIRRRSGYSEKLHVPDELTALSFHLKQNLWLESEYDVVQLTDDISCDLDAAMTVRRDGLPGKRTPEGILTKFAGLTIEGILRQIEANPDPSTLEFAFTVLSCDEDTVRTLSDGIDKAGERFDQDGLGHDISMSIRANPATGVTVHCNRDGMQVALGKLRSHCERRKYLHKAESWFGICIDPRSKKLRAGIGLEFPWKADPAMDRRIGTLQGRDVDRVGRNEKCPCGSGKKYKKCHMH